MGVIVNFWLLPEDLWGILEASPSWGDGSEKGLVYANMYGAPWGGVHGLL